MATIDAGDLRVDYRDEGSGPAVLLLHGWPDDASTWDAVAPALRAAGFRTIVPSLRGFGATRFLGASTARTGDSAILATDAIALLDALGVDRFMVAGHDWGANIAEALAVGWPERVERMAMLATPPRLGGQPTPPFWHAQLEWYHWFMATKRGEAAVRADRRGFAHRHWVNWAPAGWFDEATFNRVAPAWDNPDWVEVTLHSYRARWDEAAPDLKAAWLADRVKATRTLSLPTLYVQGAEDGVNPPAAAENVPQKFTGPFRLLALPGVGHFPQREAPAAVADALLALFAAGAPADGAQRMSSTMRFLRYTADIERPDADEQQAIDGIIQGMSQQTETVEKREHHAVRASHAKSTACVIGRLVIADDLPSELKQGLFARGGTHDVAVRFAQGPGETLGDRVSTHRGMAIKVFGAEGDRLPGHDAPVQDFVLATGTTFPAGTAQGFLSQAKKIGLATPMPEGVKSAVSSVMRNFSRALSAVTGHPSPTGDFYGHPFLHPIAEHYFSQAPMRWGDHVAKIGAYPVAAAQRALVDWTLDPHADEDGFRHAATAYFRDNEAVFEIRAQLWADAERQPIEDASVAWPEEVSAYRTVATLHLPAQDAYAPTRVRYFDEVMTFRPAHSLAAHRPLGSVMRARLQVYAALSALRHRDNGIAEANPASVDAIPS